MGRKATDLTGLVFGEWKVLHRDTEKKASNAYWVCQSTKNGAITSYAGCALQRMGGYKVPRALIQAPKLGSKIGNWTVISEPIHSDNTYFIKIRCACGKERLQCVYDLRYLGLECRQCHMKRIRGKLD